VDLLIVPGEQGGRFVLTLPSRVLITDELPNLRLE
jgi:hypothetical protein